MSQGGRWPGEPTFFDDIHDQDRCYACSRHRNNKRPGDSCDHTREGFRSYDWALRHTANRSDPRTWWQRLMG